MELPKGYLEALIDELAPFGLEFNAVLPGEEGGSDILFDAGPEAFSQAYPDSGIEDSYGAQWPPQCLDLWLKFDWTGDPVELSFEIFDLLAWSASTDPELHARLNTLDDPADHAVAVGEALGLVLVPPTEEEPTDYF